MENMEEQEKQEVISEVFEDSSNQELDNFEYAYIAGRRKPAREKPFRKISAGFGSDAESSSVPDMNSILEQKNITEVPIVDISVFSSSSAKMSWPYWEIELLKLESDYEVWAFYSWKRAKKVRIPLIYVSLIHEGWPSDFSLKDLEIEMIEGEYGLYDTLDTYRSAIDISSYDTGGDFMLPFSKRDSYKYRRFTNGNWIIEFEERPNNVFAEWYSDCNCLCKIQVNIFKDISIEQALLEATSKKELERCSTIYKAHFCNSEEADSEGGKCYICSLSLYDATRDVNNCHLIYDESYVEKHGLVYDPSVFSSSAVTPDGTEIDGLIHDDDLDELPF